MKKIFNVNIKEILEKSVPIEAESKEEALRLAEKEYFNGEIVLCADDFNNDVEFDVEAENKEF